MRLKSAWRVCLRHEAKPSFEQEKAAVENELKMKKAVADFNKAKEKLGDDAFNHPSSLAEAAKNSGLKVETQETWLSRQDAQMSGMPENLINAVFSDDVLKKKHNSEVLTINSETAWVVRAKEVREEKTYCLKKPKMRCVSTISVPKPPNLPKTRQKKCLPN